MMKEYKFPLSFYYFISAMILLICGYPIVLLATDTWQLAYCAGGTGLLLLIWAVIKQRLERKSR